MIEKLRKIICYTLIFTLFNTSFQPLYAFSDFDKDVTGASTHPHRMASPPLENPQTDEQASVSLFFKTLWGVTKSVMRRSLKPLALLAIVAHHTRGVSAGSEFQVNQVTMGDQKFPATATLRDGKMVTVWECDRSGNYEICGRIFLNETVAGPEFIVNQIVSSSQIDPSITAFSDGFCVSWTGYQSSYADIFARCFNVTATTAIPRTNEFSVNQDTTFGQLNSSIAAFPNSLLIVWEGHQESLPNIYGRNFLFNGMPIIDEEKISQNATSGHYDPSIAINPITREALVVWYSGSNAYGRTIYQNCTGKDNTFVLNPTESGRHWNPVATNLPNENMATAWRADQLGNFNIYTRFFLSNETPYDLPILVNQNTSGTHLLPRIIVLPDGTVVVGWFGNQTGTFDYYGRFLSPFGTYLSDVFMINQNRTGDQYGGSLSSLNDGDKFFAVWADNRTGDLDIYGRVLDAATLSSYLYPTPAPAPAPLPSPQPAPLAASAPSPKPAPAPALTPAPLPAPTSEGAPAPVPSPAFTPSLFTQPSSETGSLSFSEFSTYMLTPSSSSLPFSSSTVLWDSSSSLLEPSTTSPSGRTAAIIGGAAGGAAFLIIAVVVAILVKVFCFSGGDKKETPDSSPVDEEDVEEKEESSSSLTGSDRMTITNVTEKITKNLTDTQRGKQYVDFSGMSKVVDDKDDERGYQYVELSSLSPSAQAE